MDYAITGTYVAPLDLRQMQPLADYLPRSRFLPLPFLIPLSICGVSWMAGGIPSLTDVGFVLLTLICAVLVIVEMVRFPQRFGTGGIVLFGGVLVWFCQDYLTNWMGAFSGSNIPQYSAEVVAKSAFYHCLLVTSMTIGLLLPWGRWLERLLLSLPDPANPELFFWITITLCLVGLAAFYFTTESFFVALYHAMFSGWVGGIHWTVGRTGNFNYNWGGYVTQLLEVGTLSGLFGLFYALLIARSTGPKIIALFIWFFWTMYTFEDGRRGEMAKMVMPAVALLFIKYQSIAVEQARSHSLIAYLSAGLIAGVLFFAIKFEGAFRNTGYAGADLSQMSQSTNSGNQMFTEGLAGFELVPDKVTPFGDRFPGEGLVRTIPETVFWFVLHPIPRALWNSKPSDPAMKWYNALVAGTNGLEGTTISQGLAGHWYVRFGFFGVIEGGMLVGWLMRITERTLQKAQGRPTAILFSLSLTIWLFRTYRNFYFLELWPMLVAFIVFGVVVKCLGAAPAPSGD